MLEQDSVPINAFDVWYTLGTVPSKATGHFLTREVCQCQNLKVILLEKDAGSLMQPPYKKLRRFTYNKHQQCSLSNNNIMCYSLVTFLGWQNSIYGTVATIQLKAEYALRKLKVPKIVHFIQSALSLFITVRRTLI